MQSNGTSLALRFDANVFLIRWVDFVANPLCSAYFSSTYATFNLGGHWDLPTYNTQYKNYSYQKVIF